MQSNRPALVKRVSEHASGVPLPPPGGDHVIPNMATRLVGQLAVQLMSGHKRAKVVLTCDVAEYGRRNRPSLFDAAPDRNEVVEVLARRAQPLGVRTSQQAVRLLTHEV